MDEQLRADLEAKLSDAMQRQIRIDEQIQSHVHNIEHIRKTLGNPYCFHNRPSDDPESKAYYTGYASHDPGIQLIRARQKVQREIADLLMRLSSQLSS